MKVWILHTDFGKFNSAAIKSYFWFGRDYTFFMEKKAYELRNLPQLDSKRSKAAIF